MMIKFCAPKIEMQQNKKRNVKIQSNRIKKTRCKKIKNAMKHNKITNETR